MRSRTVPAALALALSLLAPAALAQNAAPSAPRAQQPAAAGAVAAQPAAPARPTVAAPAAAPTPARTTPAPSRTPSPARRSPSREPDLATTAAQVLNGVLNGAQPTVEREAPRTPAPRAEAQPAQVPNELLRSAGLDPSRLPGLLGPFLRSDAGRSTPLSSRQLRQLGQLARRNLSARQLQGVATAFSRAGHDEEDAPVLSTRELNRVAQLASRGASSASLLRSVTTMLQPE